MVGAESHGIPTPRPLVTKTPGLDRVNNARLEFWEVRRVTRVTTSEKRNLISYEK